MDLPIANSGNKFKTDVWREVPFDSESNNNTKNVLRLNDYKAISFQIAKNSAEKKRRSEVMQNLQMRQTELNNKLEDRLQKLRNNTAKEFQERIKTKKEETEEILLHIINKIEESCRIDDDYSKSQKNKIEDFNRRLFQRAKDVKVRNEEKQSLHDAFNKTKAIFMALFDRFVKTISTSQSSLNAMGKYAEWIEKTNEIVKLYETVIKNIVAKKLSPNDIKSFQILCNNIEIEQRILEADLESFDLNKTNSATVGNEIEQTDSGNVMIPSPNGNVTENENVVVPTQRPIPNKPLVISADNVTILVSAERLEYYKELLKFHDEHMSVIKPLLKNTNLKKFVFNCMKAVNTPVNTIAARSEPDLKDKFDKICGLLSGNDQQLGIAQVPGGIEYCHWLLAKKFVDQASTTFSTTNPQTIFAVAAIIVAIWQDFPVFGKLFLALLYKECPFLVPLLLPRNPGQDEKSYLISLGYRINKENIIETENQFLKRISSIQSLYSAILLTKLRRDKINDQHPHSLENGWIWLTNILNLEPVPSICSTMLVEFIQICGSEMMNIYKIQFKKILMVINQQYMPMLNNIETGGPKARLEAILNNVIRGNPIPPPSGQLPDNFW